MRAGALKKAKKPLVSVLVPVEPHGDASACLKALKVIAWPPSRLEILVARGLQPSRQRNLAALAAKGEWLCFLDSDSRPRPDLLERLFDAARNFKASAVGGPNLPPENEPWLGRAFSGVLASYFGSMAARARYRAIGKARLSGEKELILCNLMVKRRVFLAQGGFREDLYPNEENELLNRLKARGERLVYAPMAVVERPRRDSLAAFAEQAFRYGRGRMHQMRVNFFLGDLVHLLPLAALAYAFLLPFLAACSAWALAPLLAYGLAELAACLAILSAQGPTTALLSFFLFPLRHAAYGAGLVAGLVGSQSPPGKGGITIEKRRL
jgi:succinoglycan biosynthesis protein ExoA